MTFHLASKTAVFQINLSLLPHSTTTIVRHETLGCVRGALDGAVEHGARGVVSETRGFSLTLEGVRALLAFARKAVKMLINGSLVIM